MIGTVANNIFFDQLKTVKRPTLTSVPSIAEKLDITTIPKKETVQYQKNGSTQDLDSRSVITNVSDLCSEESSDMSSTHTNSTKLSMELKTSKEEDVIRLKNHLDSFSDMKDIECIYIEIENSLDAIAEEDEYDSTDDTTNVDRRRSNFVYQSNPIPISTDVRSTIKNTFNIDNNRRIRVTARTTKKNRIERRRRPHPRLEDLATKCNPVVFPKTSMMKSEMYNWMIIMIGVFCI